MKKIKSKCCDAEVDYTDENYLVCEKCDNEVEPSKEELCECEQCPKCKSYNLTVYWFNSKSYCNDYVCRDCKECFAFSKIQKKFYRLSKARQKELLILTFQKK